MMGNLDLFLDIYIDVALSSAPMSKYVKFSIAIESLLPLFLPQTLIGVALSVMSPYMDYKIRSLFVKER